MTRHEAGNGRSPHNQMQPVHTGAVQLWLAMCLFVLPSLALAQYREFDPVNLKLPKCQAVGLDQRLNLTTTDRKTGRTLTNKELVADQVSVEVVVDTTVTPAPLSGDFFACQLKLPAEPGDHKMMVRVKTPGKSVDGVWNPVTTRPNTQLKAATVDLGTVQGGCTHSDTCHLDDNCKPLVLKDSVGLWKGLPLKVVRQADSWPEAHMVLRGAGADRVLERDKPMELAWDPTQTWQVCASHPRCTPPPAKASEWLHISPVDECLDVMKKEHGVTDRSVKVAVSATVAPQHLARLQSMVDPDCGRDLAGDFCHLRSGVTGAVPASRHAAGGQQPAPAGP